MGYVIRKIVNITIHLLILTFTIFMIFFMIYIAFAERFELLDCYLPGSKTNIRVCPSTGSSISVPAIDFTPKSTKKFSVKITYHKKRTKKQKKKSNKINMGEFLLTAYCPCEECSEGYGRRTCTGKTAVAGRTIAVDKAVIPYGSMVFICGLGTFIAEDCGGAVDGDHIDIYFDSHKETENFGIQRKTVYILNNRR